MQFVLNRLAFGEERSLGQWVWFHFDATRRLTEFTKRQLVTITNPAKAAEVKRAYRLKGGHVTAGEICVESGRANDKRGDWRIRRLIFVCYASCQKNTRRVGDRYGHAWKR